MNIHYQLAGTAEIEQVISMRLAFLRDHFGPADPFTETELTDKMRVYLQEAIPSGEYICWIAFADDQAVGAGGALLYTKPGNFSNPEGRNAYVMSMYTDPSYRQMGIATEILRLLEKTASGMGYPFIELHATKEGEHLYKKSNYKLHQQPTYRKKVNE